MKFTAQSDSLKLALSAVTDAISSKLFRPEWAGVYIKAESENSISLSCRNDNYEIRKVLDDCDVQEFGDSLIPAKTLYDYVSLMDGDVTIQTDESKAKIRSGGKNVSITVYETDAYEPIGRQIDNSDIAITMSGSSFADSVSRVSYCVSPDASRLILTGISVKVQPEEGIAEFVALDGFRVSLIKSGIIAYTNALTGISEQNQVAIVMPGEYAQKAVRLFSKSQSVTITTANKMSSVLISDDTASIAFSLLAGQYVDYKRIIPTAFTTRILASADVLLNAVKTAMIASGRKTPLVHISTADNSVSIYATGAETESTTSVDALVNGNPIDITFNGKYLVDSFTHLPQGTESVSMDFSTNASPTLILPQNSDNAHCTDDYSIVLPVRTLN